MDLSLIHIFFTDNLETVSLMAVDIRTGEVAASHPVIDELPANMPVSVESRFCSRLRPSTRSAASLMLMSSTRCV